MAAIRNRATPRRYVVYLAVASFVGVVTVALREGAEWLIGEDSPAYYALSIVLAYGCGTVLNYLLQGLITFGQPPLERLFARFATFAGVMVAGSLLTMLFAGALRYGLGLDALLGRFAPAAAFAAGALLGSIVTFSASARLVFAGRE